MILKIKKDIKNYEFRTTNRMIPEGGKIPYILHIYDTS